MGIRDINMAGTVVINQIAFRWLVTAGQSQQLVVSHPTLGLQIEPLKDTPESQARLAGLAMLRDAHWVRSV